MTDQPTDHRADAARWLTDAAAVKTIHPDGTLESIDSNLDAIGSALIGIGHALLAIADDSPIDLKRVLADEPPPRTRAHSAPSGWRPTPQDDYPEMGSE